MKIGNAVVMVVQKTPDGQGALCVVIKGAVHKFDLPGLGPQKNLKIGEDLIQWSGTHSFFDRGQAILTLKRAAAGRFVVFDLFHRVRKVRLVGKGKGCQVQRRPGRVGSNRLTRPHGQARKNCPIKAGFSGGKQMADGFFALPADDQVKCRILS